MRIAVDARGATWYRGTGIGTYTDNTLRYMLNINKEDYFHIYWSGENYEEFQRANSKIVMTSRKHHRFFEQYYFPQNLDKNNIDIFHVPQNGLGLCEFVNCKKVITIHDLIPYMLPETVGNSYLLKFLKGLPNVIQLADGIITVSEFSKRDILKFFPIDANKIFVTPLAADIKYRLLDKEKCRNKLKEIYNISKPFILYIGGFSPRKNVKSLILAFSEIYKKLNKEYDLVIVGGNKDDASKLKNISSATQACSNIIFTGFVEEELLPVLYNACDVFVYPSLYEGFGLPPLEAMSCGAPVITSNITSIPEVVQDCGILINPYDIEELKNSILKVLNDDNLKNSLSQKGLNRAKNFSWKTTAEKTLNAYSTICQTT